MTRPLAAAVRDVVHELHDDLIALARDLVQVPSMTGDEKSVQDLLEARWRERGLRVDRWVPDAAELRSHPAFCDDGLPVERPNLAGW